MAVCRVGNLCLFCVENGGDVPLPSDDEDKADAELKAAEPVAGPIIQPCGTICQHVARHCKP